MALRIRASRKKWGVAAGCLSLVIALSPANAALDYYGINLAGAEFTPSVLPGTEGTDYFFPTISEVEYFQSKGMNTFRLPFRWERLQPSLSAPFDPGQLAYLKQFVADTTARGATVILDVHNFAQYSITETLYPIGSAQVTNQDFAHLWSTLAGEFLGNEKVMFGLMNEPPGTPVITTEDWFGSAQIAINAIRGAGAAQPILVSGNYFSGAWSWTSGNGNGTPNAPLASTIFDPGVNGSPRNILFEAHQYLDLDYSGTSAAIDHNGAAKLNVFTQWLKQTGNRGFLGEFGVGEGEDQEAAVTGMLNHLKANSDVWAGWTWWAGGPAWEEGYFLDIEPVDGVDAPQLAYLEPFLPTPVPEPSTWILILAALGVASAFRVRTSGIGSGRTR